MKYLYIGLIFLAGLTTNAWATVIDFTGFYDVSNWTQTPSCGNIDITGAPTSITMTSCNNDPGNLNNTDFTIDVEKDGPIFFQWDYLTVDVDGPAFDPFGFLLNGFFTQLTDNSGPNGQSGLTTVNVIFGDNFGFRIFATDSQLGTGVTIIGNFKVPEPASLGILGLGLVGMGMGLIRRRKSI